MLGDARKDPLIAKRGQEDVNEGARIERTLALLMELIATPDIADPDHANPGKHQLGSSALGVAPLNCKHGLSMKV
jgi:hypothetical protein